MHWGTEGQACPDQAQLSLAHRLAAAGASIIVGAHAHMLQGSGWLGRTFVAYGLGNFLWWERSYSTASGVLELTLRPHAALTARFIPAVVSGTGQPAADQGASARRALAHYASLYNFQHVLILGRVTSGAGGDLIVQKAKEVLRADFPELAQTLSLHLPDEKSKRHRVTIASPSTRRRYTGGPSGIRRHSAIRRLRPLTASRTSSSERRSWTVSVSRSISLRSRSGVGSSSSADTPSRRR